MRVKEKDSARQQATLGSAENAAAAAEAPGQLQPDRVDARTGVPSPETEQADPSGSVPTFDEFASEWLERQNWEAGSRGSGLADKSRSDLQWRLSKHLLPAFASKRLNEISIRDVDNYRLTKVAIIAVSQSAYAAAPCSCMTIVPATGRFELPNILTWTPRRPPARSAIMSTPKSR